MSKCLLLLLGVASAASVGVGAFASRVAAPRAWAPRPGDRWFERLADVAVDGVARTWPEELKAFSAAPYPARTKPLPAALFVVCPDPPPELATLVDRRVRTRCFEARPALALASGTVPQLRLGGELLAPVNEASFAQPGPKIWWDEARRRVLAVAAARPEGLVIDYVADPALELAPWEPPSRSPTSRHATLDDVTRDALLVRAGTTLRLTIDITAVDALHVAFGVGEFGRALEEGRVVPKAGASDGARGVVDLVEDGSRRRLLALDVGAADVGRRWIEGAADLRGVAGPSATLELSTEPGAAGDARFDYGLFGDLRFAGAPTARARPPDLVVIDLDTLRADSLSLLGNPRPTTPRLDAWARKHAAIYSDMRAVATWTLPSTMSMLTGAPVRRHGVLQTWGVADRGTPLVATRLRDAGYETLASSDGGFVRAAFGFAEGFDRFEARSGDERTRMQWEPTLAAVERRRSEKPLFLFLHTYATHSPYACDLRYEAADAPYAGPIAGKRIDDDVYAAHRAKRLELGGADYSYLRRLYDASVAATDERLAVVMERLAKALAGREVLWIVTSDHGESLGERGTLGHGHGLHEELLRVPLLIAYPPSLRAGRDDLLGPRDEPVSSLDLVPTLLAAAGLARDDWMEGRVLFEAQDERPARVAEHVQHEGSLELAGWKIVRTVGPDGAVDRLHDLAADPLEQVDLAAREPERLAALRRRLDDWLARNPRAPRRAEAGAVDAATLEDLARLGYGN